MTSAELQRLALLDALIDGPVSVDHAHMLGIKRLARRIGELRHLEGLCIETVRGPIGTITEYRLTDNLFTE
jgi:hypothetical protein